MFAFYTPYAQWHARPWPGDYVLFVIIQLSGAYVINTLLPNTFRDAIKNPLLGGKQSNLWEMYSLLYTFLKATLFPVS